MKKIRLIYPSPLYATVDDDDFRIVSQYRWYPLFRRGEISGVRANASRCGGALPSTILLHKLIIPLGRGELVDHKNRNVLDNRRKNLRRCTPSQNAMNKRKQRANAVSRFKGVSPREYGRFRARITVRGKMIHLGHFQSEESAARAYNRAAQKYFGEFACPNGI